MSVGILSAIHGPADVHALDAAELPALCGEIRTTLVRYGHVHGGHIGYQNLVNTLGNGLVHAHAGGGVGLRVKVTQQNTLSFFR